MVGSIDSLVDFSPELTTFNDRSSPLTCWQDVCLSNIWIPSNLLPSRKEPSTDRTNRGIFHRLDSKKRIESFSVYSEEEIFLSDSDEDILSCKDPAESKKKLPENASVVLLEAKSVFISDQENINDKISHQYKNKQCDYLGIKERTSNMKTMPSVDNLCNIDNATTLDINYSRETVNIKPQQYKENTVKQETQKGYIYNGNFLSNQERKLETNQKKNKKKKATKNLTLDEFLDDYKEEDRQNAACNDYFQKLMQEKNKNDGVQLKSEAEFPNLQQNVVGFIHSEKSEITNSQPLVKTVAEILGLSNEIENNNVDFSDKTASAISGIESICGKLIIENIPNEVSEDDIHTFLCGYGEIKTFYLESVGEFLKAYVEIDLICDIDWIIECLNGTEPFGASAKPLKCYKDN